MKKNYAVIVKTMGELSVEEKAGLKYKYPDTWPLSTVEVCSLKECVEQYPGHRIFTIDGYNQYKAGIDMVEEFLPLVNPPTVPTAKPWWKFWRN